PPGPAVRIDSHDTAKSAIFVAIRIGPICRKLVRKLGAAEARAPSAPRWTGTPRGPMIIGHDRSGCRSPTAVKLHARESTFSWCPSGLMESHRRSKRNPVISAALDGTETTDVAGNDALLAIEILPNNQAAPRRRGVARWVPAAARID